LGGSPPPSFSDMDDSNFLSGITIEGIESKECGRCWRDTKVCLCHLFPREVIPVSTTIIILQHPKESTQTAVGTVNLIRNCLGPRCITLTGIDFGKGTFPILDDAFLDHDHTLLLFPGKGSVSLKEAVTHVAAPPTATNTAAASTPPPTAAAGIRGYKVVLVDGTWSQAKQIVRRNSHLRDLRCVYLDHKETGEYGNLRKEPRKYFLSTLETVAMVLELIEPDPQTGRLAHDALMVAFRGLLQVQLAFVPGLQDQVNIDEEDEGEVPTAREALAQYRRPDTKVASSSRRPWIFIRFQYSLDGTSKVVPIDMDPFDGTYEEARSASKWLNSRLRVQKGDKVSPVPVEEIPRLLSASSSS